MLKKITNHPATILLALVLAILLAIGTFGVAHTAQVNKTRYYVEAYCEYEQGTLYFTHHGNTYAWEVGAGDTIPTKNICVLVMDNNGTEGYLLDDIIIEYR